MAACVDDQQTNFKHFCRICKKGFMCGRALGGHMRAHGIGDESANLDDDDQASDWEDKQGTKRMYALRTNPNRLKSVRVCENCGKEFLSWKSFLEHGKCSSDDAESLVSSPESEPEDDQGRRGGCGGWSKRKRSLRAKVSSFNSICPSSEDEDLVLAKCLMALANARVDPLDVEPEESSASASRDEERRHPMASFQYPFSRPSPLDKAKGVATKGMFECKACKKVFNSHQALGGHRASHKKVKGCFAARNDQYDDGLADEDVITNDDFFPSKSPSSFQYDHGPSNPPPLVGASRRKNKVHKCSICNRIFASGQALGGHKRCHWLTSNSPDTSSLAKFTNFNDHIDHQFNQRVPSQFTNNSDNLDLNFPSLGVGGRGGNVGGGGSGSGSGRADMAAIRRDPQNPLSFEVPTEINLQPSWVDKDEKEVAAPSAKDEKPEECHINKTNSNHEDQHEQKDSNNDKVSNVVMENVEDEVDSKVKLAKLSELKDMNVYGNSSPWLQVGLASTADVRTDP